MQRRFKFICIAALALILLTSAFVFTYYSMNNSNTTPSIAGSGANAYFSDTDNASNNANIGSVNTKIVENFEPPEELSPGVQFTKDVSVTNVGPSACFVRIKAVFTDSDMEKLCSVDWNDTDFVYNAQDGFWYYQSVLEDGDSTTSLFTTISVLSEMEDGTAITKDMMKDFDVLVYMESYQAECSDKNYEVDENGYFINYQDAWQKYQENKPTNK